MTFSEGHKPCMQKTTTKKKKKKKTSSYEIKLL